MQVIVTGASGFVGQNLVPYLNVRGFSTKAISLQKKGWKDIFPTEGNAIIHLAGKAHDTSNTSNDREYFKINRDLTIEVFHLFLNSNVRDFVYFSSVKAVADSVDGVLEEGVIGQPFTPYGKSKLEAEQYLLSQMLPPGKRLFIIRPCMIHGPGNKGNLNLLYNVVKRGIPWPLASFHNQRSFLSIDNLSFLTERMIISDLSSGIYNFADDEAISTNDLVEIIAESVNRKSRLIKISPRLIRFAVKVGDYVPFPINSEKLRKLTESYVVSNVKIKEALGLNELPVSTLEGLKKTIRSFKRF